MAKNCARYGILRNETRLSKPIQDVMRKHENIIKLVKDNYGYDIVEIYGFQKMYGILQIEEGRGFKLPEWVSQIYPNPLIEPTIISLKELSWTDPHKRLGGGPAIKIFLKNFRDKLNDSTFRNVSSYSAHDATIATVLNAMNIFNNEHPPMAGIVLMELRRMNETATPIVTIFYKNSTDDPYPLVLPNCSPGCPLEKIEAILKPIIPNDWEKECKEHSTNNYI